jgi:hypothetical protein
VLNYHVHGALPINAASASGRRRAVAQCMGHGRAGLPAKQPPAHDDAPAGRVTSLGRWSDEAVQRALSAWLGSPLAAALRTSFEWYVCRGAFFHNDAHYDDVLFGVWCIAGPPAELVFPRVGVRLDCSPGNAIVFDPFEIHGVLAPGRAVYEAADFETAAPSIFIGFELALDDAVGSAFKVGAAGPGPTLSSRTRIAATTGAFE